MASLRELIIKISANSSSYQAEIARASRMGGEYYKTMEQGNRKAEAATRQSQRALADLNGQLTSVKTAAASMAGVFVSLFAVGNIISAADQWGQYQSRIKMATGSVEEFRSVQARLLEISDRTYKNIDEQAELYIRSSTAMKELGYNTKGTIDFIDSISSSLTINAASAEKGQSAIDALSKSMVKGKVSGQEWNTVMEVMPTVIGDIARYLGTTETAVKNMAANGKLSMDTFAKATIAARARNAELAEAMPTTVGDAITKLNNHFKTYITDVNASSGATQALSGTIGYLAEHIDEVVIAAGILGGIGLARTIGGWATSTALSAKKFVEQTSNQLALAAAQREGLTVTLSQIGAERAGAVAAQQSLVAQLKLAQTEQARTVIRKQLAVNSAEVARLTRAEAAATAELSAVQGRLAASSNLLKAGLGLIGGPAGAAMLAAGAIYYFYEKSEQAKRSATELAGGVSGLIDKMREMGNVQLAAEIGKLNNSLPALSSVVVDAQKKYDDATEAVRRHSRQIYLWGADTVIGRQAAEALEVAINNQAIALGELTTAQESKSRAVNGANVLSAQLNGTLKEGVGIFRLEQVEVGVAAEMMAHFANSLNVATQAKAAFNSTSLILPISDELKKAQKEQDDKLKILKLSGKAQAEEIARQEAARRNITKPEEVSKFVSGELRNYDQSEKNKADERAKSDAASAAKKAESVTKSYEQAISNLNKEIAVEAVRLKEGDAAAALFSASLEAGTKWTAAQRAELEELNKKLAVAKQRWEDHNAAIANDPYRAAAETQKKANEQLQRQIADGEIKSAEEIARRKQDIDTAYLQAKAEAAQRYAVSGTAELAGNVDPLQNLENQLAKRHALIESYAAAGVVSQDRANQLLIASDRDAMEQRYQASLQLYASQGDMQKMSVDLFQATTERAKNMLTGLLIGTQDWKEATSNLFSSLTQSIINNLIDMAAQALLTSTIMQTITGVAGGLMGGIGGAASGAAGAAGSASTGAMGMSTSWSSYVDFNAKGGVYSSPSLSAYSGQIVSSPTMFAFAKGAGIMGEAGPEAIMPLTRAADGSLGVRAVTASLPPAMREVASNNATVVNITINSDGQSTVSAPQGMEQAGAEIGQFVDQRIKVALQKETGQGRMLSTMAKGRRS